MVNISTTVRGHYDNDVCLWAIIIRRFCHTRAPFDRGRLAATKALSKSAKELLDLGSI
jgi:hypothetical protein